MSGFHSLYRSLVKNWGEDQEPHLLIRRANQHGATIVIPLEMLWIFVEDADEALKRVIGVRGNRDYPGYLNMMYGAGGWSKGEFMSLMRFIESRLDALKNHTIAKEKSKNDIENMIEKAGLKIELAGESVIDASSKSPSRQIFLH